jgi:hypothetical protein
MHHGRTGGTEPTYRRRRYTLAERKQILLDFDTATAAAADVQHDMTTFVKMHNLVQEEQ